MTLDDLTRSMIDLDEERTLEIARELAAAGQTTRTSMLTACQQALRVVGERYERRDYHLSALIMGGEIFKEVMDILEAPQMSPDSAQAGSMVLGTVADDIHDIGKSVFRAVAESYGFTVIDIGVNVPKEDFFEAARRFKPDLVCFSGLIAAAFKSMRETAEYLREREAELGYRPFIVIGGGTIDSTVAAYVGADAWTSDAFEGVHMCRRLLEQGPRARQQHTRPTRDR